MKQTLINLYLEYTNDYLTVSTMSEHKGLDSQDMEVLIKMGKKYHEENVQLMKDLDRADEQITAMEKEADNRVAEMEENNADQLAAIYRNPNY